MAEATQDIAPEAQIAKDVEFVPSLAQAQEVQEHSMADKEARQSFVDAVFRCGICYSTIKDVYLNQEIYKDFPCTAAEYPQKSGVSRFCIMRCGHLTCLAHLQLSKSLYPQPMIPRNKQAHKIQSTFTIRTSLADQISRYRFSSRGCNTEGSLPCLCRTARQSRHPQGIVPYHHSSRARLLRRHDPSKALPRPGYVRSSHSSTRHEGDFRGT